MVTGGKTRSALRNAPLKTRFHDKIYVDFQTGCWLWRTPDPTNGYGRFSIGGGVRQHAHRVSYRLYVGPIPDGLEIDHLCRTRRCVNPEHLEAVTHSTNVQRGAAGAVSRAKATARTHCKQGHELTEENTRQTPRQRLCLTCRHAWSVAGWQRRLSARRDADAAVSAR